MVLTDWCRALVGVSRGFGKRRRRGASGGRRGNHSPGRMQGPTAVPHFVRTTGSGGRTTGCALAAAAQAAEQSPEEELAVARWGLGRRRGHPRIAARSRPRPEGKVTEAASLEADSRTSGSGSGPGRVIGCLGPRADSGERQTHGPTSLREGHQSVMRELPQGSKWIRRPTRFQNPPRRPRPRWGALASIRGAVGHQELTADQQRHCEDPRQQVAGA